MAAASARTARGSHKRPDGVEDIRRNAAVFPDVAYESAEALPLPSLRPGDSGPPGNSSSERIPANVRSQVA